MPDRTLFEKIWDAHVVRETPGESALLYIDLHLVHEVTSPQAFEGLRLTGRRVRRPELTIAVMDHNTPTWPLSQPVTDAIAKEQLDALERNCKEFGVRLEDRFSPLQGIVHVIGPELGLTQPGLTIVCGDSHTSTHGAFGALAWGIGTSEVEHVLATQTLPQRKPKPMEVRVTGDLPLGVTAKDIVLNIIGRLGIGGGIGHVIEYAGSAIRNLSMEGRMTICNMSIEAGARAGMIAPDATTFAYLKGRRFSPQSAAWDEAVQHWSELVTDTGAIFDRELTIAALDITPTVSWGTSPGMVTGVKSTVPLPDPTASEADQKAFERALEYMDLKAGTPIEQIAIDRAFIGSCTNARIEDLRAAASVVRGYHV